MTVNIIEHFQLLEMLSLKFNDFFSPVLKLTANFL